MTKILTLLLLLFSGASFASDYSDCILENMKGVSDTFAAKQIQKACREKTMPSVPAKCKNLMANHPKSIDNESVDEFLARTELSTSLRESCIDECQKASFWSKHFGDCKE